LPIVEINPGNLRVSVEKGSTILQAVQKAGVPLLSICGGLGACGKCRVVVASGLENVSSLTKAELKLLSPQDIEKRVRLACQARITGDYVSIHIPEESLIVFRGRAIAAVILRDDVYPLSPTVRKIHVNLPKPTLEDNRPDYERLHDALVEVGYIDEKEDLVVPLGVLQELPSILRSSDCDLTVVLYGRELISIEPGDTTNLLYGVAVDIGSSKIIVQLVDLNTGETIAEESVENPQLTFGADIVSRVMYAEKSRSNLIKLQQLVVSTINSIIERLAEKSGVNHEYIYEVVIVGNTVMHHLFLGIQPGYIARSPYVPAISRSLRYKASELGLTIQKQGYIYSLPVIRGFVGADAVANILATQMHKRRDLVLVIDIGTNTEVLLGSSEVILAASAPSGPAFEGAHITHGMRAVTGAIGSVKVNDSTVEYETIGGVKPRGICGTGLIDTVAELYRNKVIDNLGKFTSVKHPRLRREQGKQRFIIVPAEESANGVEIYVTPRDIESILLAKAAVKAAWTILSRKLRVNPSEINRVYVAGSFGAQLNVDNAIQIGLLPPVGREKVTFIGESAIVGAKIALKSIEARREIEEAVGTIVKYVELSVDPEFREVYFESMKIHG